MFNRDVGAVHPVAVTTKSAVTVLPSPRVTLRARPRPSTLTMSSPTRASSAATISTPAARKSSRAESPWVLAESTTARRPGFTDQRLMRRRTAPESITPGVSFPANT